ncbi:MAG: thioredoxin [Oscillospiraceae bacterium]|jgi:thioredoxin 1
MEKIMAEIIITEENFENEVLNSDKPVLVDFWAQWCGPCRMLGPIIEEIANDYEGKVKVGKVNVDEQPNLASKYGIASIPTVIVFKNGKPEKTLVGLRSKNEIENMIK